MSINAAQLKVDVKADTAQAEKSLNRVGHSVDGAPKAFGAAKIAGLALGTAFAAIAIGGATMGIKTASSLQQADIGFTTMLGSGEKAKAFLGELQTFAAATPFEFPDLVRASQRLLAMGVASKDVVPYMTSIGDAVAGLGGGPELIGQVTTAIGQMSAKGKIQSGELLQLTEAGIPALKILADQFGVSTTKMQDMVTKGLVPADKALPLLMKGLESGTKTTAAFGGMMEKQSHTMAGTWSTMMDTINMGLANTLQPLVPIISAIIPAITDRLAGAFTGLSAGLQASMDLFKTVAGGTRALVAAFAAGGDDITSSGFAGIMEHIGLSARAVFDILTRAGGVTDTLRSAFTQNILPALQSVVQAFQGAIPGLQVFGGFLLNVGKVAAGAFLVLAPILERVAGIIIGILIQAFGFLITAVGDLGLALNASVGFIQDHAKTFAIGAGVITAVFLPAMVKAGIQATLTAVKVVAAWVAQTAAAVTSAAETAAIWVMLKADAIAGAAAMWLNGAKVVAGWVAQGAAAVAAGVKAAAAWVMSSAGAVVSAAIAVGAFVAMAAGWVASGVAAMAGAVVMAAAWFVALGPIGWAIAAIVALVAVVILNWTTIKTWTVKVFTATMTWIKTAWTNIKTWLSATVAAIVTSVKGHWNAMKAAIAAVVDGIRSKVVSVWSAITGFISSTMNGIRSTVTNIWSGIRSAFSTGITNAVALVRGLPGTIMGIIGGMAGAMLRAGANIIGALAQGIKNGLGGVTRAVGSVLSAARNLLPFSPAKEGPFSGKGWTLHSGRSISAALAQGMIDNTGQVHAAALRMASAAVPNLGGVEVPGLKFGAASGLTNTRSGNGGTGGIFSGAPQVGRSVQVTMHAYNPVTEPQSVTINKTLQRVAALGLTG